MAGDHRSAGVTALRQWMAGRSIVIDSRRDRLQRRSLTVVWRVGGFVHTTVFAIHIGESRGRPEYVTRVNGCCVDNELPDTFDTLLIGQRMYSPYDALHLLKTYAEDMRDMVRVGAFKTQSDVLNWLTDGALDK